MPNLLHNAKKTLISFQNVGLSFGSAQPLFRDLNLVIHEHTFHFLIGPSGAGKSTLLRMIYLDQEATQGLMILFNHRSHNLKPDQAALLRRQIGVVFQDFRLIPHLTILENVILPLKIKGIHTRKRHEEAIEFLAWVGLKDYLNAYPDSLSGGQQQRVSIVRAIISKPPILLADEPTGNVDDEVAMRLLYLFEELYKNGTTVLVATHNQHLADTFPYSQLVLTDGRLTIKASPKISRDEGRL